MITQSFQDLVESVAAKTPTPGGGAAAALSACLGASLFLMVIRFSRGKKATLEFDEQFADVEESLSKHLHLMMPMAENDCSAFDIVSKAYGLPKETDEEKSLRSRAIEEGMHGAMIVPEEMVCMVRDVFAAISPVITLVGKNIASDLGSGSHLLIAAAESAFYNVRINAVYLKNREKADSALEQSSKVLEDIRRFHQSFCSRVDKMMS